MTQPIYMNFKKINGEIAGLKEGGTNLYGLTRESALEYEIFLEKKIAEAEKGIRFFNGNDSLSKKNFDKYTLYLKRLRAVL